MKKEYVSVIVKFDENGNKKPLSLTYKDKVYQVDRVIDVKNAVSMKVGGIGERYCVRIGVHQTNLFCERGKWFVEEK